jgi:hypothetical protein
MVQVLQQITAITALPTVRTARALKRSVCRCAASLVQSRTIRPNLHRPTGFTYHCCTKAEPSRGVARRVAEQRCEPLRFERFRVKASRGLGPFRGVRRGREEEAAPHVADTDEDSLDSIGSGRHRQPCPHQRACR